MRVLPFSYNAALRQNSRWNRDLSGDGTGIAADAVILFAAGFLAAAAAQFLDFNVKIPGHAILRTIIPVTLGIALVPRRISGTLIGVSAFISTLLFGLTGAERIGMGAMTSMLVAGPILDAALWGSRSGKNIVIRCALAGVVINLVAFAVRGQAKLGGFGGGGGKPFKVWFSGAIVSYLVCGLLAGLICGILWFRSKETNDETLPGMES
ncbi:MAG: hypothetical protein O2955_13420 [Planctomycetota bacterium]|nr:hypothetical protein [Planctomycetota bacterium]MDA1213510.1 hypothetical protein [Planctomycetota bacterium]